MKKTEQEIKRTPAQIKFEKEQEELQKKTETTAKAIEVILNKAGMALQPFLVSTEHGIVPRVRLAQVPKEEAGKTNEK